MNFVTKQKQEIKVQNGPLPFFPKYVETNRDRLSSTNNNIWTKPKYIIELAVFVDKALYDILKSTFRHNTRESVTNIVLSMIDMVSETLLKQFLVRQQSI